MKDETAVIENLYTVFSFSQADRYRLRRKNVSGEAAFLFDRHGFGRDWREVGTEEFLVNSCVVLILPNFELRHFIAGFLIAALSEKADGWSLIDYLPFIVERLELSLYSEPQLLALADYFEFFGSFGNAKIASGAGVLKAEVRRRKDG